MEEQIGIKRIYTGSVVEANYLLELLRENGIEAMLRNTLEESVITGWASGAPEDSALIYVTENHYDLALRIINEYLQEPKE